MVQRIFAVVIVVILVVVTLLDVTGLVPGAGVQAIPFLLLLVAGFAVWWAVYPRRGAAASETLSVPYAGEEVARLEVTFGAGQFTLAAGGESDLLAGVCNGPVQQRTSTDEGFAEIILAQPLRLARRRADWQLALSPAVEWEGMELRLGAAQAEVDLSGLQVIDVLVESGGTTLTLTVPYTGDVDVHVSAGETTVQVPRGAAVQVINDIRLGVVEIDEAALHEVEPNVWAVGGGEVDPDLTVILRGGLGTVRVGLIP